MPAGDITDQDFGVTIRGAGAEQKLFGRFTLKRVLGRGGMGIVWLAFDEELQRNVAMKFLPDMIIRDREAVEDLKRETRRSLDLTHHHIVRIYHFTQDETSAAIVMEYVDGETLSAMKTQQPGGCFAVSVIAPWVGHLCQALDYAHRQARVVHRDLKPANLMVNSRGDLKITDFGISRSMSDSMTRVSMSNTAGTLAYMSPEQALGAPPAALDDVYAFGATVYDLLTGRPPFFRGNLQVQLETVVPPPMAQRREELGHEGEPIPALWEEVIAMCLAKKPQDRPESMADVAAMLGLGGPSTGMRPLSTGYVPASGANPATVTNPAAPQTSHRTVPVEEQDTAKDNAPAVSQPPSTGTRRARAAAATSIDDILPGFSDSNAAQSTPIEPVAAVPAEPPTPAPAPVAEAPRAPAPPVEAPAPVPAPVAPESPAAEPDYEALTQRALPPPAPAPEKSEPRPEFAPHLASPARTTPAVSAPSSRTSPGRHGPPKVLILLSAAFVAVGLGLWFGLSGGDKKKVVDQPPPTPPPEDVVVVDPPPPPDYKVEIAAITAALDAGKIADAQTALASIPPSFARRAELDQLITAKRTEREKAERMQRMAQHLSAADAAMKERRWPEARAALVRLTQIDPSSTEASSRLALINSEEAKDAEQAKILAMEKARDDEAKAKAAALAEEQKQREKEMARQQADADERDRQRRLAAQREKEAEERAAAAAAARKARSTAAKKSTPRPVVVTPPKPPPPSRPTVTVSPPEPPKTKPKIFQGAPGG